MGKPLTERGLAGGGASPQRKKSEVLFRMSQQCLAGIQMGMPHRQSIHESGVQAQGHG